MYESEYWKYPINQQEECVLEVPLSLCFICIGYHWELSELSGEAEKQSNCEIGSNLVILCMHEGMMVMAGMGTFFL
jgi:hypothetical protein